MWAPTQGEGSEDGHPHRQQMISLVLLNALGKPGIRSERGFKKPLAQVSQDSPACPA